MKYNLFIGRWSPFHNGHKYIIDSFLNNGKPVCIAIRDSDDKYPADYRKFMIESVYSEEMERGEVMVILIPDIEQVCLGRGVGYSIVEVPDDIKRISGTEIRDNGNIDDVPQAVKELMILFDNEMEEYNKALNDIQMEEIE